MSDLVSELMGRALDAAVPETHTVLNRVQLSRFTEKFAELIVRECIAQCEEVAVDADKKSKSQFVTDAGRMLHEGMWGGAKNCSGRIKEHFGVEE